MTAELSVLDKAVPVPNYEPLVPPLFIKVLRSYFSFQFAEAELVRVVTQEQQQAAIEAASEAPPLPAPPPKHAGQPVAEEVTHEEYGFVPPAEAREIDDSLDRIDVAFDEAEQKHGHGKGRHKR